jgi:hypothetical protein
MSKRDELGFLLKHLSVEYKETGIANKDLIEEILEMSTVWNDKSVMDKLLTDLEEFEMYEEIEFPYVVFLDLFLGESVEDLTKEKK